jgi:hypothetical protein
MADERVLGGPAFVEAVQAAAVPPPGPARRIPLGRLVQAVAAAAHLAVEALAGGGRGRAVAREGLAYLWCRRAGQSGRALAATLGVSHQAVYAAATRGEQVAAQWEAVWDKLQ